MASRTNPDQIAKYQNNKVLIEFRDHLQVAPADLASNIHSQFSKLYVVALDYSKGTGDNTVLADFNLDPETFKYIANEIVSDKALKWEQPKILSRRTNNEGECKVTKLSIQYNEGLDNPWVIMVENGWCRPQQHDNGGISMEKGSYRKEKQVKVFLTDQLMKQIILQVKDYLVAWENAILAELVRNRANTKRTDQEDESAGA